MKPSYLPAAIMILAAGSATASVTPYQLKAAIAIQSVTLNGKCPRYDVEEMRVGLTATYDNPFDPDDVALDAMVTTPSGQTIDIPGFLYQDFTRSLSGDQEAMTPAGAPEWRVRYAPSETGRYRVTLQLRDRTGTATSKTYTFQSTKSSLRGFIRISKDDPHYFAYDGGGTYFPVGANICWAGSRGTFDYDDWIPEFGKQGCNYTRLWLAPTRFTLSTFSAGKPEDGKGYQCVDLEHAWKLDYVLGLARQNGMSAMLCLENAGKTSAYHVNSGGIVSSFSDFWANQDVDKWYRAKMRYLVARYGAYTNVFAWELWNEVDLVDKDPADADAVRDWHVRTARELRSMDPYAHLITTSFSGWDGVPAIDSLPEMDYVQTHLYHLGDLASDIVGRMQTKAKFDKPEYTGETGADWRGPSQDDPRGEQIHQSLWASTVAGGSGAAAMWWWDNYIAPNKLWPVYKPLTSFVADVDFAREHMKSTTISFLDSPIIGGRGADAAGGSDLVGWSTAGHHVVLAWVRLSSASWIAVCQQHVTLPPVSSASAVIDGVEPGDWTADIWDTWTGKVIESEKVEVGSDEQASVPLPVVDEDVAIKMHRR